MARTDVTPAQRLDEAFAERTNALVMPFLVCGYPDGDACARAGIAPVFIAGQTSTPERLRAIAGAARGFVYAASLLGVTGVRESMDDRARALVASLREQTDLPVAVGIGVSTAEHARAVATYADGVIVGSAVVKRISGSGSPARDVGAFVSDLVKAVLSA